MVKRLLASLGSVTSAPAAGARSSFLEVVPSPATGSAAKANAGRKARARRRRRERMRSEKRASEMTNDECRMTKGRRLLAHLIRHSSFALPSQPLIRLPIILIDPLRPALV